MIALNQNLTWVLLAMAGSLVVGSIVRLTALRDAGADRRNKRLASLRTWWVLVLMIGVAVIGGTIGVCVLMAVATMLGWHEYSTLVLRRRADRWSIGLIYGFAIAHYVWIAVARPTGLEAWTIVLLMLGICLIQLIQAETKQYVRRTASLLWGALLFVIALSHAAMLTTLPEESNPVASPVGWFLFLVILTESNDIAQALVGRRFGKRTKHQLAPLVSPNKSWEGFVGGMLLTVALAICLSPWLTPLHQIPIAIGSGNLVTVPFFWSVVSGVVISICGLLGDINLSAVKRDVGVKDSSQALPGMGGILDRIDSLTFTAPAFYYLIRWLTT